LKIREDLGERFTNKFRTDIKSETDIGIKDIKFNVRDIKVQLIIEITCPLNIGFWIPITYNNKKLQN